MRRINQEGAFRNERKGLALKSLSVCSIHRVNNSEHDHYTVHRENGIKRCVEDPAIDPVPSNGQYRAQKVKPR